MRLNIKKTGLIAFLITGLFWAAGCSSSPSSSVTANPQPQPSPSATAKFVTPSPQLSIALAPTPTLPVLEGACENEDAIKIYESLEHQFIQYKNDADKYPGMSMVTSPAPAWTTTAFTSNQVRTRHISGVGTSHEVFAVLMGRGREYIFGAWLAYQVIDERGTAHSLVSTYNRFGQFEKVDDKSSLLETLFRRDGLFVVFQTQNGAFNTPDGLDWQKCPASIAKNELSAWDCQAGSRLDWANGLALALQKKGIPSDNAFYGKLSVPELNYVNRQLPQELRYIFKTCQIEP